MLILTSVNYMQTSDIDSLTGSWDWPRLYDPCISVIARSITDIAVFSGIGSFPVSI